MATNRTIRRGDGYVTERETQSGTRYQARWHDGTKWRAKTFATEEQAEDHLRQLGRKRRRGHVPDSDLTVLDAVNDYLARGASRWKPNTAATYGSIRDRVIDPTIGSRRLMDLTPRIMQQWIDELATQYAPARVEMIRAVAGGALGEAMRLGLIDTNPLAGVRMPRSRHYDHALWSEAEIATVLGAAYNDVELHTLYVVALTTAMRPGELRALKWGDVDLDAAMLTCRRTMTRDAEYRHVVGDTTKTGKPRPIALPPETVDALKRIRRDQAKRRLVAAAWSDQDLVFDRGNGAPMPQQTLWRRHKALIERTKVTPIRLHDLRHLAATLMLARGVNVKVVSEVLGHTTIATTLDIYADVLDDQRRDAASVLGDALFRRA